MHPLIICLKNQSTSALVSLQLIRFQSWEDKLNLVCFFLAQEFNTALVGSTDIHVLWEGTCWKLVQRQIGRHDAGIAIKHFKLEFHFGINFCMEIIDLTP